MYGASSRIHTGIAEDGFTYAFEYIGLPKWLAEIAARAIVFFL